MENNIHLTQFSPTGQNAAKEFILETWKEFPGYYYDPKLDFDLDAIEEYYVKPGGMFYLLKDADKIIGTIGVINKGNHIAEFKRMYVDKNYRGKKLGSKLFDTAIYFVENNGFIKVAFQTDRIFEKAHKLYLSRGFQIIDENTEEFFMEKNLV